ncbi:Oidioi.mRNA.OKI2018_I69.chr2.g5155.t1.cds [Oikopleura dioica]|uniref:Oidioi.mRNA.OKI2018_I69.chr2.g5155.t1.cds n=1 Tax=Oikopleura dioica TaxID=34765 RepID=A0ABN7T5E7_OIKDI|nr:Oidioi.mRNA.OKI2018_I69.chr2.g5155.t1.cds [Oikopleura dioica]
MRLLASFFAFAAATDVFEESVLSRTKRQAEVEEADIPCDAGELEYDGVCYEDSEESRELIAELSQFDSPLFRTGRGRGPGGPEVDSFGFQAAKFGCGQNA